MGSILSCDITKLRFFVSSLALNFQRSLSCGDDVDVVRNPVGDTHKDVDGIFGVAHEELKNEDVMDPFELDKHLQAAFVNYKLPVTILHVDATFDY